MALKHGALVGALMVAVVRSVWPGDASATAYDVVIVSVDRLTEQFVPDQNGVLGLQGMIIGSVTTSNMPGPFLNQTSGSYTQVTDGIGEIGLSPMGVPTLSAATFNNRRLPSAAQPLIRPGAPSP